MYATMLVIFFTSIIAAATMQLNNTQSDIENNRAETMALNEIYYASAVKNYVTTNSFANGTIADSALGLDSWYNNLGWTNTVVNGTCFIYPTSTTFIGNSSVVSKLLDRTDNSQLVGVKKSGQFYNPVSGFNTSISLPSGVPDNAPVYVLTTK